MSVGKSTTAPTTLWTHTAGWKITHWNTETDRRKIFCWEREEMTTRSYLIAALPVALGSCHSTQARRVHASLHCRYQAAGNLF